MLLTERKYGIILLRGFVESAPAIANGVVYVGSDDGNLYALNATSGAKLWNYTTSGGTSSPAVAGSVVFVGGFDGNLYALSASTGNKLWNFTLQLPPRGGERDLAFFGSPAVVDGRVYIGSNVNIMVVLGASNSSPSPSTSIPEFPFGIIFLTLLILMMLAAVVIRKKKISISKVCALKFSCQLISYQ